MNTFDKANAELEDRNWSTAEVHKRTRKSSVVHSVRMPHELTERLVREAQRRGVTPSEVIRDLVDAGLASAERSPTVRLVDVHRAIDSLTQTTA
jgi:macrodomain Ter protein organizer (MatP/YcbG family)